MGSQVGKWHVTEIADQNFKKNSGRSDVITAFG